MALIDRAIGFFSPEKEFRRLQARRGVALLRASATRNYEGARAPRRGMGWSQGQSANAVMAPAMAVLRERARDLVRNTPMARVPDVLSAHIIGVGITPVSRSGNRGLDKKVNALFNEWQQQCFASGEYDFYGGQALAVRSLVEGGEAFLKFIPRPSHSTLPVPLQLSLHEGDQIDESKNGPDANVKSTASALGISFNEDGSRAGYWFKRSGDIFSQGFPQPVYVEAADVAHVYRVLRIGQVRGVSWLAPVVLSARDLADYIEASLIKARTESCFAAFVKSGDPGMPSNLAAASLAGQARAKSSDLEMAPGLVTRLDPGEDVVFAQPTSSNNFEPFVLQSGMSIAAGVGITYDQLTGDLRQANYSSLRAGKIEFRAMVRQHQHLMLIHMLCRPVWRRFIDAAVLAGKLPYRAKGYPVSWIAPGFEPIDPLKDLKADILAVRSGRMTWDEYVAEWGNDPQTQMEELARINGEIDKLDLTLDTDPRKVASSGMTQPEAQQQGQNNDKAE